MIGRDGRTRDGIAAARAEGRYPGGPKLDREKLRTALILIRDGISPTKAARHVGLGCSIVYRELVSDPTSNNLSLAGIEDTNPLVTPS